MSFSNSSGGTLALPSPTHAHHIDVTSAVRSLRRSLSRSPSKLMSRSNSYHSQSSDGSLQASPQSPCRRFHATPQQQPLPSQTQSAPPVVTSVNASPSQQSLFTPFRPNVRLSLRSAKARTSPSRPLTRARVSPKSPLKRALNAAPDTGNPVPSTTPPYSPNKAGQENHTLMESSPTSHKSLDRLSQQSFSFDSPCTSPTSLLKSPDKNNGQTDCYMISTSGALKRSDATMNLDQPSQGSPVAKRRSLHGISGLSHNEELSIFGSNTTSSQSFNIHEDLGSEYELSGIGGTPFREPLPSPTPTSSVPKRTSSLRKSTLQQRYGERGSLGRRTGERQLAQMSADFSPVRNRPRLSLDQFVPPPQVPRESPFASALPNPSVHPMDGKSHQPHPLSKTLTTSSSGNSLTEETPLYAPVARAADRPKHHPFSRSLPLNATRPTRPLNDLEGGIATPSQSQLWVGAFNSTGLVSKVNRNPEEDDKKMAPPDTPCKKHSNPFATFPPPAGSAMKKRGNNRNSFGGLPTTPFNPAGVRAPNTFGNPGKGLAIFQRGTASRNARRGSVLSLDGDERKLFGEGSDLFSTPLEGEAPPTPTKNTLTPSLSNLSEQSLESPSANRTFPPPTSSVHPDIPREATCKLTLDAPSTSKDATDEPLSGNNRIAAVDCGQSPLPLSPSSFGQSRARKGLFAPTPLDTKLTPSVPLKYLQGIHAKMNIANPASPLDGRRTPQTPQESLLPLDTSRLSISQTNDGYADYGAPPVTPTGGRDFKSSTSHLVTPVNGRTSSLDADASLYSRFDKVDQIGKGEFSTVYRVTKYDNPESAFDHLGTTTPSDRNRSPAKGQVFAVKKSKHPYTGPKDRDTKLREVHVLQALTHADHVVKYVDTWEHNFYLYIQTEFCEEGTLDRFLGNHGRSGRLDDFRIFKILQDLCLVRRPQSQPGISFH